MRGEGKCTVNGRRDLGRVRVMAHDGQEATRVSCCLLSRLFDGRTSLLLSALELAAGLLHASSNAYRAPHRFDDHLRQQFPTKPVDHERPGRHPGQACTLVRCCSHHIDVCTRAFSSLSLLPSPLRPKPWQPWSVHFPLPPSRISHPRSSRLPKSTVAFLCPLVEANPSLPPTFLVQDSETSNGPPISPIFPSTTPISPSRLAQSVVYLALDRPVCQTMPLKIQHRMSTSPLNLLSPSSASVWVSTTRYHLSPSSRACRQSIRWMATPPIRQRSSWNRNRGSQNRGRCSCRKS